MAGARYDQASPFVPQVGLTYVRGCEVEGMLDEGGRVIEDGPDPRPVLPGERRTFRVWLDCNQYRQDLDNNAQGKEVSSSAKLLLSALAIAKFQLQLSQILSYILCGPGLGTDVVSNG